MTFRQFLVCLAVIGVLYVLGPLVAAGIVSGAFDWVGEFFAAIASNLKG